MKKFTELTRGELEVMQKIWERKRAFLADIYELFPEGDDRPAYPTVQTFVRILERKGFIGHKTFGKANRYHPLISKEAYANGLMQGVMSNFFDNSPSQLLSFFTDEGKLTPDQAAELKELAKKILEAKN